MGMFDTYDNLQDNYIPNNVQNCPSCTNKENLLQPNPPKRPYENYNELGELIGYWWYYGDTIDLEFNISGDVIVEDNAIIYYAAGQTPTRETKGEIDQKAYNVIDMKSWTCLGRDINISETEYIWEEDAEFSSLEEGQRNIYITAQDFMKNKQVTFQLLNFRMEQIAIKTFKGSDKIIFNIDKELSEQLVKSNYYGKLTVWDDDGLNKTLLAEESCTFTVK